MEQLYGYVFWYNHYEAFWYAVPTEDYTIFFSGKCDRDKYLKAKNINNLIEFLSKGLR